MRENTQINKMKSKTWDITTNTNEIQRIMKEYFKTYIKTNWENLE
jgi:hypothetical protein